MASAQTSWIKGMRNCICAAQDSIAGLAAIAFMHPSMRDQLKCMQTLRQRLRAACVSQPPRPELADSSSNSNSKCEYTLLIAEFSVLWSAMVVQLDRLTTGMIRSGAGSSLGTTEEVVFWELWSCFTASCHAFQTASSIWPEFWSGDKLPVHSSWYAAWHSFLTWLFVFSRSPAWLLMKRKHGRVSRNSSLIVILTPLVNSLVDLTVVAVPPATILSHVSSLPTNFFPLFCCIVSEQFGSVPPVVRQPRCLCAIPATYSQGLLPAYTINICVDNFLCWMNILFRSLSSADIKTGHTGSFSFLTSPAVLQCLKVILILPRDRSAASLQMVEQSAACLHTLLTLACGSSMSTNAAALSVQDRKANMDETGLPLHINPLLSKVALETDVQVLHVLSTHMDSSRHRVQDSSVTSVALSVQVRIAQEWMLAGRLYPLPPLILAVMVKSVVGLARQCALLGLQRIVHLQAEGSNQREETSTPSRQQLSQQLAPRQQQSKAHQAATARLSSPLSVSPASLSLVRNLLFFSSHFQIYIPGGKTIPNTSPELRTLNEWCVTPGWAAATEALHRGAPTVAAFQEVHHFAIMAARSSVLLCSATPQTQTHSLRQHISLAATVRKVMWIFQQRDKQASMQLGATAPSATADADHVLCSQMRRNNLALVTLLAQTFVDAILGLDVLLANEVDCSYSSTAVLDDMCTVGSSSNNVGAERNGTGVGNNAGANVLEGSSSNNSGSEPQHTHRSDTEYTRGGEVADEDQTQGSSDSVARHSPVNLLQTLTLLTLAQISCWLREGGAVWAEFDHPAWLARITAQADKLHSSALKDLLAVTMCSSKHSAPLHQREVDLAWEQHAVSHLNGRLLPGCCHIGCTNLDGASEATLKTLLCGGCRRARYCSGKCQKAAWLEGGHSNVCSSN